jgi:putative MATE family efflux protein
MLTQIIGAVINIILDPIFIFGFNLGVAGAAWATVISQFISFVWVMYYFNSHHPRLRFRVRAMKLRLKLTLEIMAIGFAPFAMAFAMSFVNIMLNRSLFKYGGDIAVAAMGIVYSILIMVMMPLQGLNAGAQPIIGYNYGAKKYDRVITTYKLALLWGTAFACLSFLAFQLFPGLFIALFRNEEGELMETGKFALRVCTLVLPFLTFQVFSSSFFQAIGKPLQASILSLSRQILFYIPLLFILPTFFGLHGVYFAMPTADICSVVLSFVIMRGELKRLKKEN